jgi:hypothetical protein
MNFWAAGESDFDSSVISVCTELTVFRAICQACFFEGGEVHLVKNTVPELLGTRRGTLPDIRQVFSQSVDDLLPPAVLDVPAKFLKGNMNHVVMM